jgi:hypothetical protein
MAYTISRYVYDSAKLKGLKKLLHELVSQHSKTAWFPSEHARLLSEISELEAEMQRFERYHDKNGRG